MGSVSKEMFLGLVATLYRLGNRSDSDDPNKETWTKPAMSGKACCALLDKMMTEMVREEILTEDEKQRFYDDLI